VADLSERETYRVLSETVDTGAHLMSDQWKAFVSIGEAFAAHDTVRYSSREYARGPVHANSAEGFNDRVRRTVAGVFHHISPEHADLYFTEIGFRWSQRVVSGQAVRQTRKGRRVVKTLWSRIPPALQCQRHSNPRWDANCAALAAAGSRSAVPWLSLVDKGVARITGRNQNGSAVHP
jgi:hypothetical protein